MNIAERRKLEAAANKLLKGSGKKSKAKYPGTNLPFKIFTQTQGAFIPNHAPNCIEITKWEDINSRQNKGRYENLPNKTYHFLFAYVLTNRAKIQLQKRLTGST